MGAFFGYRCPRPKQYPLTAVRSRRARAADEVGTANHVHDRQQNHSHVLLFVTQPLLNRKHRYYQVFKTTSLCNSFIE